MLNKLVCTQAPGVLHKLAQALAAWFSCASTCASSPLPLSRARQSPLHSLFPTVCFLSPSLPQVAAIFHFLVKPSEQSKGTSRVIWEWMGGWGGQLMQIQQFPCFREGGHTPADILLHHEVKLLSGNGPSCHPNEIEEWKRPKKGERFMSQVTYLKTCRFLD